MFMQIFGLASEIAYRIMYVMFPVLSLVVIASGVYVASRSRSLFLALAVPIIVVLLLVTAYILYFERW